MAKVDVSAIEGYESMSAEEKVAALEGYEFKETQPLNDNSSEITRLKEALSKSNSEAADYKRQLRAKQSDDEIKAEKEKEERDAIMKELESLRKDKAIGAHKTALLSLGYEAELAGSSAKALFSGDYETFFANEKKFIEMQKKAATAAALDKHPGLSSGNPVSQENMRDPFDAALRRGAGLPI